MIDCVRPNDMHANHGGCCSQKSSDRASPRQFTHILHIVRSGGDLSVEQAAMAMQLVLSEEVVEHDIEAYLCALADKGESVDEIVGSAIALRERAIPFAACVDCIDNCGTGGDGAGTFNISTVSALVIAAAGCPVVKHGNRSASGRVGSADLLEGLEIQIDLDPTIAGECFRRLGFVFLFAPKYHVALGPLAAIRRRIGKPTIFNLVAPLCNPANPPFQFLGAPNIEKAELLAQAIARLGIRRAFVVTAENGVDELIPGAFNTAFEVEGKQVSRKPLDLGSTGVPECSLDDLRGGDLEKNVSIAIDVLRGGKGPCRNVVVLNAGAALLCAGVELSLQSACERCAAAIDRGHGWSLVHDLCDFSNAHEGNQ